ncbi:MAG TPA: BON domain-containing protein [Caulobacterales bacterium]|nr:BON domain-containing protein [Caulobacterales bacterium]
MRTMLTLAALTACGLSSGCVTAAVGAAAGVGVVALQDRTIGEALDDATASNEVKARLLAADAEGFSHVDVEVAGGSLLLSGSAPTEQHRTTAETIARNVRSIHAIYDEIQVGEHRSLGRNAGDEWITAQVRTRLVASPHVHGVDVNIETFRGNVYLMGVVRSQAELEQAAQIASLVPGVQRVVSFMLTRNREATIYSSGAETAER